MIVRRISAIFIAAGFLTFCAAPAGLAQSTAAGAVLLKVRVAEVPEVYLDGFSGDLGTAAAGPPEQSVLWDGSDPTDVFDMVGGWSGTPAGPGAVSALTSDSAGTRHAETGWAGVGVRLRRGEGPNLISVGTLRTYARCTRAPQEPGQTASAPAAENTVYLFDNVARPVADGTQTVRTTGDELGLRWVGDATLTITKSYVRETGEGSAHAAVRVDVDAVLHDEEGTVAHRGDLLDVTFGDVRVDCADAPPTTTTPPVEPTTTPPTTTPPVEPTAPTTTPGVTSAPAPPQTSECCAPDDSDALANTGANVGATVAIGALLVLAGTFLVSLWRRRSS